MLTILPHAFTECYNHVDMIMNLMSLSIVPGVEMGSVSELYTGSHNNDFTQMPHK